MRYIAYILRQIGYLLIGLVVPFLCLKFKIGLVHLAMAFYYNISMVLIVWLLSYFAMPFLLFPCQSER